jgi:hypothetical protein
MDSGALPPISWEEVKDHMVARLFIDPEWSQEGLNRFTWWPWFLRQDLYVEASGSFDDGSNWIRVRVEVPICTAPESLGLGLVEDANARFPLGVFTWSDGLISLGSTWALNPLSRQLLSLLHEQALAQATFAHEQAIVWQELDDVELLTSAHPRNGPRNVQDDLLEIYAGDELSLPQVYDLKYALEAARPVVKQIMLAHGWEEGFSADDVDFYNGSGFDMAVGLIPDSPQARKFGYGLVVMIRLAPSPATLTRREANYANLDVAGLVEVSQLAPIVTGPVAQTFGSHMRGYLPAGYLAEHRSSTDRLAVAITNALAHMAASVAQFRQQHLNIE